MVQLKNNRALQTTAPLSALLLLAACGGSGSDAPPVPAPESVQEHSHQNAAAHEHGTAPTTPSGLPAPVPMPEATLPGQVETTPPAPHAAPTVETITLASATTPLVAATINAPPYWPVWTGTGQPVDGVNCLTSAKWHQHFLISIYKDGKRLGFPDGIGRVRAGCYHAYELHVHDVTGLVHMESAAAINFKLGQWFSLWRQPVSRDALAGLTGPVRYYIIENGKIMRYDGNPADIAMLPHREVLIITGAKMSEAPNYQWPAGI